MSAASPVLRYFRFKRRIGGLANDGDEYRVSLRYRDDADLGTLCTSLGVELRRHETQPPQPVPGVRYSGSEMSQFASLVPGTAFIEQPGLALIEGVPVFVWASHGICSLVVHGLCGDPYCACDLDREAAARLEPSLALWADRIEPG